MKRYGMRFACICTGLLLAFGVVCTNVFAAEVTDEAVLNVMAQLEAIDTLQQIQDNRSLYSVADKYKYYDVTTTNTATATAHETARAAYEAYVNEMFTLRAAAKQAYEALTDAQKAQIDPALVDKLANQLPTVFRKKSYSVTPRGGAYTFEAVGGEKGFAYEVSNHMVGGQIAQSFLLVNTADGKTEWTPNGPYVCGESNYEVTYCCDVQTPLVWGTDYRRINLEDSNYYGSAAAKKIRAILQNAYPFITVEEMRADLRAAGYDPDFVNALTRADMIAAVQMAVWTYSNNTDFAEGGNGYFASISVDKNSGSYFTPLHDYTNECWEWYPGAGQRSYDARTEYRVNSLVYYLCNLQGVEAREDQIVISQVEVARTELLPGQTEEYRVGMNVYLNHSVGSNDALTVTVTSFRPAEDGSIVVTDRISLPVSKSDVLKLSVKANSGDTIQVEMEGTQDLGKGVYFYEPEGGREVSQCLVGVASGETNVYAEESFVFEETVGRSGLRIYKTEMGTGRPISDITFRIYRASDAADRLSQMPMEEEVLQYAVPENLAASVTTDATGYGAIALEPGCYLVVEVHNQEKIKEPVAPFYLVLPMQEETTSADGTVITETVEVLSLFPKNEVLPAPEGDIVTPPAPDKVVGRFEIVKHDAAEENRLLSGAQFFVYRAATADDTEAITVTCDGVQYTVVPVIMDGAALILETDQAGKAVSPDLDCGTYYLVEKKAPAGYILSKEAVSVQVLPDAMTAAEALKISNQRGSILPETGGVGTTVFFILGGGLMLIAVILLVTKRRMRNYK